MHNSCIILQNFRNSRKDLHEEHKLTNYAISYILKTSSAYFIYFLHEFVYEAFPDVKGDAPIFQSLTLRSVVGSFDLAYISQLQNLRVFNLDVYLTAIEKGPVSHPRCLKQLDVHDIIYDPSNVLTVLGIYRDSDVESLSLEGALGGEDFKTILSMVSSQWSRSVTTLALYITIIELEMGTEELLDIVRPLHSLHNVQFFTAKWLGPSQVVYFTDTVVYNLCNGWHNLIHFDIWCHHVNANITLASLKTLSGANCTSLKRASIPFDVLHIPSVDHEECDNTSFPLSSSHHLEFLTLIVGGKQSDLNDFVDSGFTSLAYHLDTFFPFLKDVCITIGAGREEFRDEVMDIIRRRQEASPNLTELVLEPAWTGVDDGQRHTVVFLPVIARPSPWWRELELLFDVYWMSRLSPTDIRKPILLASVASDHVQRGDAVEEDSPAKLAAHQDKAFIYLREGKDQY
ncbi:hypothetical protein D9758_005142 [Tetrapyrgos nigripes]|uniref:Uncharacterized protein n=1 Tax=Tetrapyrgos nigripes TaxID=182062 RepID=A0A8H5GWP3_9AGAR|nr:hypothetical protein D9758_005142 [Tetrapyrgos nigripes]